MNLLKTVSNADRLAFLGQLEDQADVAVPLDHPQLPAPLGWDRIRELAAHGVEIGSHTVTHPFLANLTDREMARELAQSKREIEARTGAPVKSMAYPFGNCDRRVMDRARDAGYEFGITYAHDARAWQPENRMAIPRIHVEPEVDFSLFLANLLLPRVFLRYGS